MPYNAALAYRVLDHIEAHPSEWYQGYWYKENSCGTTACFAGWTVLLSGQGVEADEEHGDAYCVADGVHVADGAAELLGFDDGDHLDETCWRMAGGGLPSLFSGSITTHEELAGIVRAVFGDRPERPAC